MYAAIRSQFHEVSYFGTKTAIGATKQVSQPTELKITLIKETVPHYIGISLRCGASADHVKKVLSTMYSTDFSCEW